MIRHVVLLNWNDKVSAEDVQKVTAGLAGLPDQIPEIKSYIFGPDLNINDRNADYVLVADFDSEDDFKRYVVHPAHQDFMKAITGPITQSFQSAQFQL